jgi:ubiquinone/menaquinone biosynthesis C-methylase UbiE
MWAIEVAGEFPSAQVTGVDISLIQPKVHAENVEFCYADFTKDLPKFEADSFDCVHSRSVLFLEVAD